MSSSLWGVLALPGSPQLKRSFFFIAVDPLTGEQKFPVNLMSIKFWAIDTGEFGYAAN